MKKGLAVRNQKKEKAGKLKVKKRNQREGSEGVWFFLFFHFLSKASSREDSIAGEGGFPFCKTERENRESEFSFESLFSSWKRKVGVPWASVVFLSPLDICICIFICSDSMNDEKRV